MRLKQYQHDASQLACEHGKALPSTRTKEKMVNQSATADPVKAIQHSV